MIDPRMSFDTLVVTPANQLVVRAARGVAEAPGALYNPLIIQGPPGVGKTHLLHAIALHTIACEAGRSVLLEDVDRIVDLVTTGVTRGTLSNLHDALAGVDILLLDDFEGVSGRETTQEEIATVFAEMLAEGRQIVLSSRHPSADADDMIPELRRLLAGALLVEIEPMKHAGRDAIVRKLARERMLVLGDDVVTLLTSSSSGDIGELERLVACLADSSARTARPPTVDDVYALLGSGDTESEDEFDSFLEEVTQTLSVLVETAPWRRRIAQAILRWEAEGVQTHRLDDALRADTPPDVDELIEGFARDARRLLEIRAELKSHPRASSLDDVDDIEAAEALLRAVADRAAPTEDLTTDEEDEADAVDAYFFEPARVVLDWVGVEERLEEGTR